MHNYYLFIFFTADELAEHIVRALTKLVFYVAVTVKQEASRPFYQSMSYTTKSTSPACTKPKFT